MSGALKKSLLVMMRMTLEAKVMCFDHVHRHENLKNSHVTKMMLKLVSCNVKGDYLLIK